jgi:hypothetical protein
MSGTGYEVFAEVMHAALRADRADSQASYEHQKVCMERS